MRAIIVDPQAQSIREEEVDGKLESLQKIVGGYIEGIYPAITLPEFEGCHGYVNEEFLYTHPEWRNRPWRLGPYEYLCGPAVFMGSTDDGNEADCPIGVVTIAKHIQWLW